ncbi:hypothetical protein [Lactobacillus rhamnosus DSM 14870] [Lactiplantibacillus mudanjiangensis]|uniref:ASCH domain-containing protein n=1 Tax=Lactiplantibacillus mudanjiangensis TaxID=1296538 RepID=UPI001015BBD3|nr:ASCH domain-containing protein [Lactiplantibacillus mudanjiangensis]VDG31060.1 hypothetical protein [Lactobacillus rhamnosus DSM 14870] [Lactiplantibacillus mudanjiangensis]
MNPAVYFEQAKQVLNLPADAKLTSAYKFGDQAEQTNQLGALVVAGTKTATASAADLYEADEPLPQVGEYDVVLDANDEPLCVTKTDSVTIKPFSEVDATHAYREGEGDRSLAYWRQVHQNFFEAEYLETGRKFDLEQAPIVLEQFHVIYPI